MFRGLLALEVVVILLLIQPNHWFNLNQQSNVNQIQSNHCSRGRSKIVRTVLSQKFYPILEKYKVQIPYECPFHPEREELWWPDVIYEADSKLDKKKQNRLFFIYDYLNQVKFWLCPVCGKEFLSSEILILHFDENHYDKFKVPDHAICLADYCDIVRCDVLLGVTKKEHQQIYNSKSIVESSSELVLDSSSSSNEPKNSNCDKDKLKNLFDKCIKLVRQCTLGTLELESSMNEFDKLETELTKSICSYLTCDQYYTNNLDKPKKISILFLLFLILFIICLFSICYCCVWTILENDSIDLQLISKIQSFYKVINLANLVKLVYLVNLVKCKWLCKKKANKDTIDGQLNLKTELTNNHHHFQNNDLQMTNNEFPNKFKDELLLQTFQQTKLPFKMKQSIFSVRSSSSDSIKKMQQEHLRNLEIHERQLRELEKLRKEELERKKIIEEDQLDESEYASLNGDQKTTDYLKRDQFENEFENEFYDRNFNEPNFNKRRFTNDGEIVSTKSKSEDKDSYYDLEFYEANNSFRNVSNNDALKMTYRKDQRRPSEQSICRNSVCSTRIKISTNDIRKNNEIVDQTKFDSQTELRNKSKNESKNNLKSGDQDDRSSKEEEKSPHKRVWEIAGDITLLNQARLKLLEQRAASRQLNYQSLDENNQSNRICKITKFSKPEIELKELRKKPDEQKLIYKQTIDRNIENRKNLFKQKLSNLTNKKYLMASAENGHLRKPILNPLINQIAMFDQQTRSQPTLISQMPKQERPDSTNSTPCNR